MQKMPFGLSLSKPCSLNLPFDKLRANGTKFYPRIAFSKDSSVTG